MPTLTVAFTNFTRFKFRPRHQRIHQSRLTNAALSTENRGLSDQFFAKRFESNTVFNADRNHLVHDAHEVADIFAQIRLAVRQQVHLGKHQHERQIIQVRREQETVHEPVIEFGLRHTRHNHHLVDICGQGQLASKTITGARTLKFALSRKHAHNAVLLRTHAFAAIFILVHLSQKYTVAHRREFPQRLRCRCAVHGSNN